MKHSNSIDSQNSAETQASGFAPWQWLKGKKISYLTLPLLIMATITEFVILATGFKYQQVVCLPQGMGVTFFGIGPIGATILAVELLKLPLAIWTASRRGWQKGIMMMVGLPLICLLTFQLVKDMAVYEMGVAMTPASQMLEKGNAEETKIAQLTKDLNAVDQKKAIRDRKLEELNTRKAKSKAELEESLKRDGETRQDAITLTDYQKKELSEVEARQATIIKQFDADTAQLTKSLAELRAQRETEVGRATKWNAEEARIENDYKTKMSDYANEKAAYEKAKAEYDSSNYLKRKLMREPVDPGVPPVRETNTILKPVEIADVDAQIKTKEAELLAVNNKRRDRVAQVDADARRLREEFDRRSSTKREESDHKREELLAAQTALTTQWAAEEKAIDQEYESSAKKVDGIRAEIDAAQKAAEGYYDAREASIKNTQVHRIATTVEIVRGLLHGQRPVSIKATAKERGDLYTDQISMVRIWVYPILAFIVAFLPTLMVEIGFSTVFQKEDAQRPPHRLGFLGRRMHWVYKRAGRLKILRAERLSREATSAIAVRDAALANAKAEAEQALAQKDAELQAAREAVSAAASAQTEQLSKKEGEWVSKYKELADSLNRAVIEKDALKDLQKSEVERQIQMRQNAWSDRLTQLRQELDDQRAASEAERTTLLQEQHEKLMAVTEDCKAQVIQARRQMADAELAAVEKSAKMVRDLAEAQEARDAAETLLKQQTDTLSVQLAQAKEDASREVEKAVRLEKHKLERQQFEFDKALRQRDEDFDRQLKQREQELTAAMEARDMAEAQLKRQADALSVELAQAKEETTRELEKAARQEKQRADRQQMEFDKTLRQREDDFQQRLAQREQEMAATMATGSATEEQLKRQAESLAVQLTQAKEETARELEKAARQEKHRMDRQQMEFDKTLRQREEEFKQRLEQRELEVAAALETGSAAEAQLKRQAESLSAQLTLAKEETARELEKASRQEKQRAERQQAEFDKVLRQREEDFEHRLKQREQDLNVALDARLVEEKARVEQAARRREEDLERQFEARAREVNTRWTQEMQQRDEAAQNRLKQREQQLLAQAEIRVSDAQAQADEELRRRGLEMDRQLEAQSRDADMRLRQEVQQKELAFHAKLKQREQELSAKAAARETELQEEWAADQRIREEELERQAEARIRASEVRATQEAQQKEELFQVKLRQREQQLQTQFEARQAEWKSQRDQSLRTHEQEWERNAEVRARATETRWQAELQQKDELFQSKLRQRDEQWQAKLDGVRAEAQAQTEQDLRRREVESAEARLRAVRDAESNVRKEMQEKVEAALAGANQREQELTTQLAARAEAIKVVERERDEARQSVADVSRQVQDMKNKLVEASSVLTGWKNGSAKQLATVVVGRDGF